METRAGAAELASGFAFVDLSSWRAIAVSGSDAFTWLNDLVSADLDEPTPGRARRSLLLGPTGGILASFTVAVPGGRVVLIQDPREPRPIDGLLAPYVLSSDVTIEDRSGRFAIFAFPGRAEPPNLPGTTVSVPSAIGRGSDVVALAEDHDRLASAFAKAFAAADDEAAEVWRIEAGIARVGVDSVDGDLPQESGLENAVSFEKGCFLGQEAVAKVRNLGHPRRVLLAVESPGELRAGDEVVSDGERVGSVTSAARFGDRWVALARVGWEHRDAALAAPGGAELRRRDLEP